MTTNIDRPPPTEEFGTLNSFVPDAGSSYIYASVGEERSFHEPAWEQSASGVQFVPIIEQNSSSIRAEVNAAPAHISLRSGRAISEFIGRLSQSLVFLDITGLAHGTWAPLVRAWLSSGVELRVVYREPHQYNSVESPSEGRLFELSDDFGGVKPLPGFASLVSSKLPSCFIPLLGFEGPRHARLLEDLDGKDLTIIPVVGIPGFRVEYPYHAYLGNRSALLEGRSVSYTRFAAANCPFETLFLLEEIGREYPDHILKVGLVGTKPHALGAVLCSLRALRPIELLHDHPVRSAKRTSGIDRVLIYHVSALEYAGL